MYKDSNTLTTQTATYYYYIYSYDIIYYIREIIIILFKKIKYVNEERCSCRTQRNKIDGGCRYRARFEALTVVLMKTHVF
jgi:hypothetical protein